MKKILIAVALLAVSPVAAVAATATQTYAVQPFRVAPAVASGYPARLSIPAINLDSSIDQVGVNWKGEMAVPSGKTRDVGWYRYGTMPGQLGSAVIAAHIYAAFANLKYLAPGSDIYVTTSDNSRLHFVVDEVRQYRLGQLSPELLFNRKDDERLNLITCAGQFRRALGTYDQRLVIYARLLDGYV